MPNPAVPLAALDQTPALPERWVRGRRRAAGWCLGCVMLLGLLLSGKGGADQLDSGWLRARFSILEAADNWTHVGPDQQIALVVLDDHSLDVWKQASLANPEDRDMRDLETSFRWAGHIARGIEHIQNGGARVIGVDWVQPEDFDSLLGVNDCQQLGAVLSKGGVVLVKEIRDDLAIQQGTLSGQYVMPAPSLRYALPNGYEDGGKEWMGFAEAVTQDSIQTSFYPELKPPLVDPPGEVSFAERIVQKSGILERASLPIRPDGTLLINFNSNTGLPQDSADENGPRAFEKYSLSDVEAGTARDSHGDPPNWKDRIVLIGVTFKGNNDKHFVPFFDGGITRSRMINGVEVQANAVATLLRLRSLREATFREVWIFSVLLGGLGVTFYASANWGRAAFGAVAIALVWSALSLVAFKLNFALPLVVPLLCLAAGAGGMGGYRALSEERERAEVMRVWGRHQDPRLISELLAHPEWRGGEGREMVVTVLFADLKNFTKTVEALPPAKALEALNRYLSLLSSTILEHGGIVDKYLGDGLMAQWGAPSPRPDHGDAAVRACLDIERRLRALTPQLKAAGEVTFETRLTLHTGPVVAGPLGADQRLEYTIIGDTVNVTSRLQETAKQLDCDFLISETTREICTETVNYGREAEVEIRGRQQPLRVFEVVEE